MGTRDEFVERFKTQIDSWNAELARWEEKTRSAQAEWQAESARQLENLRSRRDAALYQLKLVQDASSGAWEDAMHGAEQAWTALSDAFAAARSRFQKK